MPSLLNFLVDLIYVALAVITLIVFTKRGFIDSVFRFGRTIVAGAICYFVGPSVSDLIYEKFIYKGIFSFVSSKLETLLTETAKSVDVETLIDNLPFIVRQLVDREQILEKYGSALDNFDVVAADFAQTVSEPLSGMISNLIAYVLVFLASMLALFLVFKLLNGLFQLPVLKTINKVLGFILGVFAALLFLGALTFILGVLVGLLGSTSALKQLIESSMAFRWFNGLAIYNLF